MHYIVVTQKEVVEMSLDDIMSSGASSMSALSAAPVKVKDARTLGSSRRAVV
jgi:hypothetical protein